MGICIKPPLIKAQQGTNEALKWALFSGQKFFNARGTMVNIVASTPGYPGFDSQGFRKIFTDKNCTCVRNYPKIFICEYLKNWQFFTANAG